MSLEEKVMSRKGEVTYRKVSSAKNKSKSSCRRGKVDDSMINNIKTDLFEGYESPIETEIKPSLPCK
jgi:hypothetical protein